MLDLHDPLGPSVMECIRPISSTELARTFGASLDLCLNWTFAFFSCAEPSLASMRRGFTRRSCTRSRAEGLRARVMHGALRVPSLALDCRAGSSRSPGSLYLRALYARAEPSCSAAFTCMRPGCCNNSAALAHRQWLVKHCIF